MGQEEQMLQWFDCGGFSGEKLSIVGNFTELAHTICALVAPGPERTVTLRKLLEGRDAALRAIAA